MFNWCISRVERFYEEHKQGLYTYALSITRNRASAEDAVHTAIYKVLKSRIFPLELKPYIFRCVRNAAIDEWRTRKPEIIDTLFDLTTIREENPGRLLWQDIEMALFQLSEDERETILLKTIDGMTFRQIARITDSSINTIASKYRRGLEKLKNQILHGR